MEIEFRIIEDENLPIIFIDGEDLRPIITINAHSKNRVWLSIHRNTIPGIAQRRNKSTEHFLQPAI